MRRLTRPAILLAGVILTSGLISIGSSLPASAAVGKDVTVSSGGCTEQLASNMYKSGQTGYQVVKITMVHSCGWGVEAGITCNGGKDGKANIWGKEIYNAGDESFASCNANYPAFDGNGGFRIWFNGAWQYHTEIYT
jgi:hypothetical protein